MDESFLEELGIIPGGIHSGVSNGAFLEEPGGEVVASLSPATGETIAKVRQASLQDYEEVMKKAVQVFREWRMVPAPQRGAIVREIGDAFREKKEALGRLVSLEMGKILAEGLGEVQEVIDMCDFAVGLSRQLYGLSMHSERPHHRMYEQWHPLGPVGVITAFNFPVAVWGWNAMIAAVCGDVVVWKPSHSTPLTAVAAQRIVDGVLARHGFQGVMNLVVGRSRDVGETLLADRRIPLVSATGSCRMGRHVGKVVAERLGRTLLELGGNNAVIVMDDADPDLVVRAVLFGAVGTAGQRCTSTRRLILQKGIAPEITRRLVEAYKQVEIGDPLDPKVLMGPLINELAVEQMMAALEDVKEQGGEILYGGKRLTGGIYDKGFFVEPTLVKAHKDMAITKEETFAPILYIFEVEDLEEAVELQNSVDQGLSSSIFTRNLLSAETFLSHKGSDCGIANVNLGTSGAEIGGAFGGEKDTGGGREAGSDAWKAYMRRQTCTINWGTDLPLAQGIHFGD